MTPPGLRAGWRKVVMAVAATAMLFAATAPAAAQSMLRDAETEALLDDMARPLVAAAGLQPGNVRVVLIGDRQINAFVAGGQVVYINAGLLLAADTPGEVQGVIAHELGHVVGGHAVLSQGTAGPSKISVLSLLVGLAALAAGAGSAGMAAMMAGQQAALGKYLAFSRTQEASADAFAVTTLNKAQLSGKGMISFFGKLKKEEFRMAPTYADIDPFAQTHPLSADRQTTLEGDLSRSPYWSKPQDPVLQARLDRVKAKLYGYMEEPKIVLNRYPESDQSVEAHYARAYAWHRAAYPDKAVAEVAALTKLAPHDAYYRELQGQILLESGKPREAIPPLREAVTQSRNNPMIGALLGHALIATEDQANFAEAKQVLKVSVARDVQNPFAWYQLGIVYDREGDQPRAALATAERYSLEGQAPLALSSAEAALRGIPEGTPDWIRAQDIAMTARTAVEQERKRK
ncbi:M48 family metalloprotease [Sphingomonas jatrophae]|uniref:Putative Zn-dependent protease, contains TPR repeats n=1 Tax=Sphingomonas jatrophae TaxID=1166337 RepID=A0A1I6JPQ3_9SPHN|nr:M48 family metalloprotease [Sphingomonas jatrophae]SFR80956.1 Putative Zn-dependent protease, contains TPR repeats [Sphingomonas jatrophae]